MLTLISIHPTLRNKPNNEKGKYRTIADKISYTKTQQNIQTPNSTIKSKKEGNEAYLVSSNIDYASTTSANS